MARFCLVRHVDTSNRSIFLPGGGQSVRVCVCLCVQHVCVDGRMWRMTGSLTKWMKGTTTGEVNMRSVSDRLRGWRKVEPSLELFTESSTDSHI